MDEQMSGTAMLIVSMLKAFMPKEAAEQIGRMASDGTFDAIAELPKVLARIEASLARLERLAGLEQDATPPIASGDQLPRIAHVNGADL